MWLLVKCLVSTLAFELFQVQSITYFDATYRGNRLISIENAKKATEEFRFPKIKGVMARALPYNMHAVKGEPGGKDVQSTSVFVKGFEKLKWTHEDLYAKFCTFGRILSCKVSIDAEHNFLGFGYIQFSKIEEAQRAIQEVSNQKFNNSIFTDGQVRLGRRRLRR